MPLHVRSVPLAALAALVLLAAAPAHAQGGPPVLTARVTSAATGEPLRGAEVVLPGSPGSWTTDDAGVARIPGLLAGRHVVQVRMLGYAPRQLEAHVDGSGGSQLAVQLAVDPVRMAAIEAEGDKVTWGTRMLQSAGFFSRQRMGGGRFITRDQIAVQKEPHMTDLLRRFGGLRFNESRNGSIGAGARTSMRGSQRCTPSFFVDGIYSPDLDVSTVNADAVEGIEVYRGASETPSEFRQPDGRCGAILIWTRVR